jgi:aryl-alcohol dehydrogenase-like predicted oxidoreductase
MANTMPESVKKSVEETKVDYVKLGKSGLKVSVPILGAMSFGHPDWAPWVIGECPWPHDNVKSHGNIG